jgi:Spy/CpxP family protein refolding chaperone
MKRRLLFPALLFATAAAAQILPPSLAGRWWNLPQLAQRLSLTPDQQKKMDDVFQQNRLKLIDLTASLDKEEATLEPMVAADQPDPVKIRPQIDRVAQARAELEKANANMLLGIRLLLTPEQWKTLQAVGTGPRPKKLVRPEEAPQVPQPRKTR